MRVRRWIGVAALPLIAGAAIAANQASASLPTGVLFFDGFEDGTGSQWALGDGVVDDTNPYAGTYELTFAAQHCGGDSVTANAIVVSPSTQYYLHTAYATTGESGFLGIRQYTDAAGTVPASVPEIWVYGDTSGFGQLQDLNGTSTYAAHSQAVTTGSDVGSVRIEAEDFASAGPCSAQPLSGGAFFDNVELSSNATPSYTAAPTLTFDTPPVFGSTHDLTPTYSGTTDDPTAGNISVQVTANTLGNIVDTLTATPDSLGNWSVDGTAGALAYGDVVLAEATQTNPAGLQGYNSTLFSVDNAAPTADGVTTSTNEDVAKVITLTGHDTDLDSLAFSITSAPTHGSLGAIGTPDCSTTPGTCTATVTYTPTANYNGTDQFKYKVSDGFASSSDATVDITVNPVADNTTLNYIGPGSVNIKSIYAPKAKLSSTDPLCYKSKSVFFSLNKNPTTGLTVAGGYAVGGGVATDSSGQAYMQPGVSTNGWVKGTYTATAKFNGSSGTVNGVVTDCNPSSGSGALTIKK